MLAIASLASLAAGCKSAVLGGGLGSAQLDAAGVGSQDGGAAPAADAGGPGAGGAGGRDGPPSQTKVSPPPPFDAAGFTDAPATDAATWIPYPMTGFCPATVPSAPTCPREPPVQGSPCPLLAVVCEYGGADLACRGRWRCSEDQTWQPTLLECGGSFANRCPADAPPSDSACDLDVTCSYPVRAICQCSRALGRWVCQSASAADPLCPERLPLYGSTCDRDGMLCRYGGCFDYVAKCCGGTWISNRYACSGGP